MLMRAPTVPRRLALEPAEVALIDDPGVADALSDAPTRSCD